MYAIIDAAFGRTRTVVFIFIMIILMGSAAYLNIPKESEPDVPIPTVYVSMSHEGISPEDAERLLLRPMEKELQSLEGLKEMRSLAGQGHASVTLEFDAGFNADKALTDVREKVDRAKSELPSDTDEPRVTEVNVALFPILTVAISGSLPERQLVSISRKLKDQIEALEGVLEVDLAGSRDEVLEVIADPAVLETYNINFGDLTSLIQRNNRLIAAGALDAGSGHIVLKIPGVIENIEDVMSLPLKTVGDTVVTFGDLVKIRRTFKDADGYARFDGKPGLALEIKKRLGANIIETVNQVRKIVEEQQKIWPASVKVSYLQDKSKRIQTMLGDLQNNVLAAIALVVIVVIAALGLRPGILVGLAIPGSFLAGILAISYMGMTLNIVVLFSLILVVGMLVDGAVVTVELADRKMADGLNRKEAYTYASKRMAWPIIASTATTLAVFIPLVSWPGVIGEFMKFLPITVLLTLAASLAMALVFIPVLGGFIGNKKAGDGADLQALQAAESGDLNSIKGMTGSYLKTLGVVLNYPATTLTVSVLFLIGMIAAFVVFGKGVEFFPSVDPDFAQVQVRARGDMSVVERDKLVSAVEKRVLDMDEVKTVYARTLGFQASKANMPEDTIGVILLEFVDWKLRRTTAEILETVRQQTADIPGIIVDLRKEQSGPASGKPIKLELTSIDPSKMNAAVKQVNDIMKKIGGFTDIEDSRPLSGIEWRIKVDRQQAARYGADVAILGETVKMITTGIKLAEYRPDDAEEELDILLRFPLSERNLGKLYDLRVPTAKGQIPIRNFVKFSPAPKIGTISRTDARRVIVIQADAEKGLSVDNQTKKLKKALAEAELDPSISISFKGQDKDQKEAASFLANAFILAIFLMVLILVTQFNSIYQAILVLSAIVFSIAGVLLGLLLTSQPFGIVMCGIGVIALAGIVVNNNIVLIDTYNDLKKQGMETREAILRTGAQRLRPVLLTAFTTILGLIPMVFAMSIDLVGREISFGAPSTQMWTQLSSSIAGGLAFATLLTLVLTPCMLAMGGDLTERIKRGFRRIT
ncbi:MAG: efflux RND transporter permease subunit [Methyloligellaceae bacterium]